MTDVLDRLTKVFGGVPKQMKEDADTEYTNWGVIIIDEENKHFRVLPPEWIRGGALFPPDGGLPCVPASKPGEPESAGDKLRGILTFLKTNGAVVSKLDLSDKNIELRKEVYGDGAIPEDYPNGWYVINLKLIRDPTPDSHKIPFA